ncbi:unnamed protein product, partial [Bubo scandiacus]
MWETSRTDRYWQCTVQTESIHGQLKPHCMNPPQITRVVTEHRFCFALKVEFLIAVEEKIEKIEKLQYENFAVETNPKNHIDLLPVMSRASGVLFSFITLRQPLVLAISISLPSSPESLPDFRARHQTVWGHRSLSMDLSRPPERLSRTAGYAILKNTTRIAVIRESSSTCKGAVEVMQDGASDVRRNLFPSSCTVAAPFSPFRWVSNSVGFPWAFALGACSKPLRQEAVDAGNSPPAAGTEAAARAAD